MAALLKSNQIPIIIKTPSGALVPVSGGPVSVAQVAEATLKRAVIEGPGTGKQNFGRLRQAAFAAGAYIGCLDTRV